MRPEECRAAKCEYLARTVENKKEYWCNDCDMNVSNVWNCGIIDEWYIEKEKKNV